MRKTSKKNLKIAVATTIALFSLATVFTATIAWFALNQKVNSNATTLNAKQVNGRLNRIDIYELNDQLNPISNGAYVFKSTPTSTIFGDGTSKLVTIREFEQLDFDHPIMILFTLTDEYTSQVSGDMYVKGFTEVEDFLGATEDGEPLYELGSDSEMCRGQKEVTIEGETVEVDCYPLSSVVNFQCAHYSTSEYSNMTTGQPTINIPTSDITLRDSFVNFEEGADIDFESEPKIFESVKDDVIRYIVMVVNYDPDAVTAIYSTYLGDSTLEGTYGGQLFFTCDFGLEVF